MPKQRMMVNFSSSDRSPLLAARATQPDGSQNLQLSSGGKAFGNIIISVVGAGVLGLPYTCKISGWLSFSLVLVIVALASYYCMMLLVWLRQRLEKDADHHISTYSDLGFLVFGKWGRFSVDAMVVLSQGAFCVAYLIFIGENLASVIGKQATLRRGLHSSENDYTVPSEKDSLSFFSLSAKALFHRALLTAGFFTSKEGFIWVIFPLQVALASVRTLTNLAPFSIAADLINALAMAVVMQQDVVTVAGNGVASIAASQGLSSIPFAVGVAIYAFEGFGLVLPLEASMKDRKAFGRVLGMAMACITLLYMVFGLLGYMAFGDETFDIVTLNLGTNWTTAAVKLGLCFGLFFTFPVMMHPVYEVVERRLAKGRPSMILRTLIVLLSVVVSVAVPQFGEFLSLIGNSVCCVLAFVLPALFHVRALRGDLSKSIIGLNYLIITFGLTFGIWGTISSLKTIIHL